MKTSNEAPVMAQIQWHLLGSSRCNIYNPVPRWQLCLCLTWCSLHASSSFSLTAGWCTECCHTSRAVTKLWPANLWHRHYSEHHLITWSYHHLRVTSLLCAGNANKQPDTGQDLGKAVENNLVQTEMMMFDLIQRTWPGLGMQWGSGGSECSLQITVWIPCSFLCVLWLMSG